MSNPVIYLAPSREIDRSKRLSHTHRIPKARAGKQPFQTKTITRSGFEPGSASIERRRVSTTQPRSPIDPFRLGPEKPTVSPGPRAQKDGDRAGRQAAGDVPSAGGTLALAGGSVWPYSLTHWPSLRQKPVDARTTAPVLVRFRFHMLSLRTFEFLNVSVTIVRIFLSAYLLSKTNSVKTGDVASAKFSVCSGHTKRNLTWTLCRKQASELGRPVVGLQVPSRGVGGLAGRNKTDTQNCLRQIGRQTAEDSSVNQSTKQCFIIY